MFWLFCVPCYYMQIQPCVVILPSHLVCVYRTFRCRFLGLDWPFLSDHLFSADVILSFLYISCIASAANWLPLWPSQQHNHAIWTINPTRCGNPTINPHFTSLGSIMFWAPQPPEMSAHCCSPAHHSPHQYGTKGWGRQFYMCGIWTKILITPV